MNMITSLIQPLHRSHSTLGEERSNVLPVLLQQRHQEVYRQEDILSQFILGHLDMSDSNSQTKDLLHLELDGSLDVIDFVHHLVPMSYHGWELAGFVETRSQKTRDLFDQGVRSNKTIISLGQFLHQLLILVQLLQSFYIHVWDVVGFRLITMGFVTKNTDLQLGSRDVLQFDSTTETLVSLRIVILESNLQFDSLQEVPFLGLGMFQNCLHDLIESVTSDLRCFTHG